MSVELKELYEKRAVIVKEMTGLVEETGGKLDNEQQERFDKMEADESDLTRQIENVRRINQFGDYQKQSDEDVDRLNYEAKRTGGPTREDYVLARQAWMTHGKAEPTRKQLEAAQKCGVNLNDPHWNIRFHKKPMSVKDCNDLLSRSSTAANVAGTTGLGSEAVDTILRTEVERAMAAFGGMREACTVFRTAQGGDYNIPTNDDTGSKSVLVTEASTGTTRETASFEFKQKTIRTYMYHTNFVKASLEFVQDAVFNLPAFIGTAFGERVVRGTNEDFTVGATDLTEPFGVATEATTAVVMTTGADPAITYANLVSLEHSVDPASRGAGARWMMHDSTLRILKTIVDGDSRPLWRPGIVSGDPDLLMGYPYTINQDCATNTTATGAVKILLFGNFMKYMIRDVLDMRVTRVNERFIDVGQVAWIGHHRHGGRTITGATDAGNWPVQALITPAT